MKCRQYVFKSYWQDSRNPQTIQRGMFNVPLRYLSQSPIEARQSALAKVGNSFGFPTLSPFFCILPDKYIFSHPQCKLRLVRRPVIISKSKEGMNFVFDLSQRSISLDGWRFRPSSGLFGQWAAGGGKSPASRRSGRFFLSGSAGKPGDGLFRIIRRTINRSERPLWIKLIIQLTSCFAAEKYAMPCIIYDGNPWGNGNSPKGLTYNGQP